jgi:hypothetical protein
MFRPLLHPTGGPRLVVDAELLFVLHHSILDNPDALARPRLERFPRSRVFQPQPVILLRFNRDRLARSLCGLAYPGAILGELVPPDFGLLRFASFLVGVGALTDGHD